MIIDNKGRLFGKVSIVDLFVLIVLGSIIAFGLFKIGNSRGIGITEPMRPVTITFFIEALEDFTADVLKIGDPVADNFTNVEFGNITQINRGQAIEFNPNHEGILVPSKVPGFSSLEITSQFVGHEFENGVLVSGHTFFVGESIVIRAGNANIFFRISSINIE